MTIPLGTGYPDFGRLASEAQVLEINDVLNVVTTQNVYPAKYVGNAKALMVWGTSFSQNVLIQLGYFGDGALTIPMDTYRIFALAGDVVRQPVPILGPWVRVIISRAVAGALTYTLQVWRIPEMGTFAGTPNADPVFSANGTAIGGSSTAAVDNAYVSEGPAVWTGLVTNTPWDIEIVAVDYNGVETILDQMNQATPAFLPRPIYLPPWHIRAKVFNENAAGSLYDLYMTRKRNI